MKARTKTFRVSYYSELEDRRFDGAFTTKKLTIGDVSRMGVIKAQMAEGLPHDEVTGRGVDRTTSMMHEMLSHFNVSLVSSPDWWDPEDFIDPLILQEVYKEVLEFETSFQRSRKKPDESGISEDAGSSEPEGEGGPPSTPENLVDKKVPKITQIG